MARAWSIASYKARFRVRAKVTVRARVGARVRVRVRVRIKGWDQIVACCSFVPCDQSSWGLLRPW